MGSQVMKIYSFGIMAFGATFMCLISGYLSDLKTTAQSCFSKAQKPLACAS